VPKCLHVNIYLVLYICEMCLQSVANLKGIFKVAANVINSLRAKIQNNFKRRNTSE